MKSELAIEDYKSPKHGQRAQSQAGGNFRHAATNTSQMAGIKKDVVVRGILDKIELWDPDNLKRYEDGQSDTYEDVASQLLI